MHAPGRREPAAAHRAAHHLMLGHGLAAARLHEAGAEVVGVVLNLAPVWPESARRPQPPRDGVDAIQNRVWLGPLVDGAYDDDLLALAPTARRPGRRAATATSTSSGARRTGWASTTTRPCGSDAGDASEGGVGPGHVGLPRRRESSLRAPRRPQTAMGWEIEPRGLRSCSSTCTRRTGLPLVVTENGAAFDDTERAADGSVDDPDRIAYLREHIAAVERARDAGADVRAYVAWTLLDNFEWAEGYTKKFGLVEVDRLDQHRTPKASYRWYSQLAHAGSLRPEV